MAITHTPADLRHLFTPIDYLRAMPAAAYAATGRFTMLR